MIRPVEPRDIPRLKELAKDFEGDFGRDFIGGLVYADSSDVAMIFVGAYLRAEVHMAVDGDWKKPRDRWEALKKLHRAMEVDLSQKRVGEVTTWLDEASSFGRRLLSLGWKRGQVSWRRRVSE